MFNNGAPSLSDIAAVTDGNRSGGWSDGNGWWVLIILFAGYRSFRRFFSGLSRDFMSPFLNSVVQTERAYFRPR